MIYRCIEHYDITNHITNIDVSSCEREKENDCFICLDVNSYSLFQLNELCIEYYKYCKCGGYVHRNCLQSWFIMSSNKCPICRNNMKKKIPLHIVIIDKTKNYVLIYGNMCLFYTNIFLQNLYYTSHIIIYAFLYFIGFLHFVKLIFIFYMLCLTAIEDEKQN